MASEEKLDWIYKGANSLVDREDYLLGRKIDKPLEQLNEDEKEKKFILPTPKNHVEHECIPPSIRDFNKIVHVEQVDLSAKLQEDPLIAIKKRAEEARRLFLQNPIQLKKLQEALKQQETLNKQKKGKKKRKDESADVIISKLKTLETPLTIDTPDRDYKSNDHRHDFYLKRKFNKLREKLSKKDIQDILESKSDNRSKRRHHSSSDEEEEEDDQKPEPDEIDYDSYYFKVVMDPLKVLLGYSDLKETSETHDSSSKSHKKIMYPQKPNSFQQQSDSESESHHSTRKRKISSSSDSETHKKSFGLISSDGKKIPLKIDKILNKTTKSTKSTQPPVKQPIERKHVHKMTEEEKEQRRIEMMQNAKTRDKEREYKVKKLREKDRKEEELTTKNYDAEMVRNKLLKSAKNTSVEERIKSKLNNIQRSSKYMDQNFAKK